MSKRSKNKLQQESKILKFIAWFLGAVVLVLLGLSSGYYLGSENTKNQLKEREEEKKERRLALLKKIEQTDVPTADDVNERLKKVLKQEKLEVKKTAMQVKKLPQISQDLNKEIDDLKGYTGAAHEYASDVLEQPPSRIKRKAKVLYSSKPQLAIIIDDVCVESQVKAIKSLNMNLTMAFLPPSKGRSQSAKLAAKEDFYMVHLPMEAQNYSAEEPYTLRVNHTQQEVSSRIRDIKNKFPDVKYINNHTGSKYTADERAMNRLILALNSNNISFVDSRTTAKTKVPKVMKNFSLKYVARDVFLDHHMEKDYIKGQIKEAVRIAKSEGTAIAIGHPHKHTLAALRESRDVLNDVDLVYINKIY